MNAAPEITLELTGPRGHADLEGFAQVISTLRNSVNNVARCVRLDDEPLPEFDVADLRYGSACVFVAPAPESIDIGYRAIKLYENTVRALEHGLPLDSRIDWATLHALNGYSNVAKRRDAVLKIGDTIVSRGFATRVAALLEPEISSFGMVTGRLESLTIHGQDEFTLYPPIEGEAVKCVFNREDLESIISAVDHTVTVYGRMHYARTKAFPVRCDALSFEVVPDEELPTLINACGSIRSDRSSVDAIRELRDDWG